MAKKTSPQKPKTITKPKTKWSSIFDKNHTWEDKDEVLDVVYWSRQILAILMGLVWGFMGITGIVGIVLFAILNSIAAHVIAHSTGYEFDPDENFLSMKEGFMTTTATFVVTWIVTYTGSHFS